MTRKLQELADYWESDTEEYQQIHSAISEIERLKKENQRLTQEGARLQSKIDRLEGYKHIRW